jgi:hypothetical protein
MIDHQVLKECLREELDKLDMAEPEKDRLVSELNVLARILIDAVQGSNRRALSEAKLRPTEPRPHEP